MEGKKRRKRKSWPYMEEPVLGICGVITIVMTVMWITKSCT